MTTKVPAELSSTPSIVDNGNATAITIDSSEKVGIGAAPTLGALHVTSSLTDIVTFENTDAGTTGAQLILYHNSSSPADGDRIGALNFKGQDDAGNDATYAGIRCLATDVSNTTEDGTLTFSTTRAGTFTEAMRINESGNVGIGTTSPTTALHSYSSASSTPFVVESTTNTYLGIKNTSQTGYVGAVGTSMIFENNGSERMRIGPNGQLSVGIAGSGEKFYVYGDNASEYLGLFYHDGNNQNRYGIRIVAGKDDASDVIYHVRCDDGDGHPVGYLLHENGTLQINQGSDERLKENIVDSTLEGINTLKNIRQREFNFKRDTSKTKVTGYVAQEMESVYPAAISVMDATQDGSAPEDDLENPYKTLSKTALIDVLIKATQEQQDIIDDLKTRIETLEAG